MRAEIQQTGLFDDVRVIRWVDRHHTLADQQRPARAAGSPTDGVSKASGDIRQRAASSS